MFHEGDTAPRVKVDGDIFNTLEPVAKDVADLTPDWLNCALGHSGFQGHVTGARCEPIGIGQVGRSYRVNLTYSDDQHMGPGSGGPPAGSRWLPKRGHLLLSNR